MAACPCKEKEEPRKPNCTCPHSCMCEYKDEVVRILRSKMFRDKYGSLVDQAVTENGDFGPDRENEQIAKMETEAYFLMILRSKILQYPPIEEGETPMPKRHMDVFWENGKGGLKEFYTMPREEMAKLDVQVWEERNKWLKQCEERYLVTILCANHQSEEHRKTLYSGTVTVLLDYLLEEAEKNPKTRQPCSPAVHALRAMSPFVERLTEAGLDRVLRLVEKDDGHKGLQREVIMIVLCWINHPKYGIVVAETLGKILLNCTEEHYHQYVILMREIFYYICPIPGVHMSVPPDVFSMLIKFHCIVLLLSSHKEINRVLIDNLRVARAFDSIPIVEKAYESNRVEVDTYHGSTDCHVHDREVWIWEHGKSITSSFMTLPEKPHRFALKEMPELAELVEKNNPKPIDPKEVQDLLKRTENRVPMRLVRPEPKKNPEPKDKSINPKKKKYKRPEKMKDKSKSAQPETENGNPNSTEQETVKSKQKSAKKGSAGKTKAEKSSEKTSSKPASDADRSTPTQTQQEKTSADQVTEQTFKVKQLQRCGFCNRQELPEAKFQKCGRCRKTRYCSKECQQQHWRGGHKEECEERKTDKAET
uniref:phytol kinase n=1 Tax=Branchiostoma floridae TaxID=7739 RepID=C3YH97_BRAFL|eukprot:XP_002604322.1 hypothetical protein BRAFLDRAFT_88612 [Branchiostoma floridae]